MRASLASATSLLALLLMERHEAAAVAITTVGSPSFGYVLVTQPGASSKATITAMISGLTSSVTPGATTISAASGEFAGGGTSMSISHLSSGTVSGSEAVTFTFAPSATGSVTDTITGHYAWSGGSVSTSVTLTGTGVAPSAVGPATSANANYVLVGQSSTLTLSVSNTGNGNLAGTGTAYNLNGSFGASGNSVFVGSGTAAFSLTDNSKGSVLATSSASYGYTFKPTITGAVSTSVVTSFSNGKGTTNAASTVTTTLSGTGVAPIQSVSQPSSTTYVRVGTTGTATINVANIGNGNLAGTGTAYNLNGSISNALGTGFTSSVSNASTISLASSATSTLGYTYTPTARGAGVSSTVTIGFSNGNSSGTNLSQSVAATLTGVGVGPVYASATSIQGGSVISDTPTAKGTLGSVGPVGSTISFGSVGYKQADTIYLELKNTTTDSAANALLTDLTIDNYSISGANASDFSVASLSNGSVITEGGMLLVPITVVNNQGAGVLSSSLTIFTDESVALGGNGDSFTYALTTMNVPEPTSLAVLGSGLAGLAGFRRRRGR